MKTARFPIVSILIITIAFLAGLYMNLKDDYHFLESRYIELQQQLQSMQQEKQDFKEGKYTLITNLSSSIYLNSIPASLEKEQWWEDVNGVRFCDVTANGTHYRYVEGHIPIAQLPLYAPNLHVEVVSEKPEP